MCLAHLLRALLFIVFVCAAIYKNINEIAEPSVWPLIFLAMISIMIFCIIRSNTIRILPQNTSLDKYIDLEKRRTFFAFQIYPIYSHNNDTQSILRSVEGGIAYRLRKLLIIPSVWQLNCGATLLALFMYLQPGLPDFLGIIENDLIRAIIRYLSISIIASSGSLFFLAYFTKIGNR
jgi:hypothetical protein